MAVNEEKVQRGLAVKREGKQVKVQGPENVLLGFCLFVMFGFVLRWKRPQHFFVLSSIFNHLLRPAGFLILISL